VRAYPPNPWQSPSGPPSNMREFVHEYDLEMEHRAGPIFWLLHSGIGTLLSFPPILVADTSMSLEMKAFVTALMLPAPLLIWLSYRTEIRINDSLTVQNSMLSENRHAHHRQQLDPSKPLPCRASVARLANPFRKSRVLSRLGYLSFGFVTIPSIEYLIKKDSSVLGRAKYFLFPK
jgi:hypothetical protein